MSRASLRRPSPPAGGELPRGFDFTGRMSALCREIVRLPQLRHVDMQRVAVSFSQARKRVNYGLYAALTPMRFEDGAATTMRQGRPFCVQKLRADDGREILYILSFYLPRFMDLDFHEKLVTIFHELWHISPKFDGDLRRHPGRCYVHSESQKKYDARMAQLADAWLALKPPPSCYHFLQYNFDQLHRRYSGVYGVKIPQPKLIPLASREVR